MGVGWQLQRSIGGRAAGLPRWKLWRMIGNMAIDSTVGSVPLIGDAFDVIYRSNTKNLRIVKKHLDTHHPHTQVIEG